MPLIADCAVRAVAAVGPCLALALFGSAFTAEAAAHPSLAAPEATSIAQQSRDSNNRQVRVHNQTGSTMAGLEASRAGQDGGTGDLLRSEPLMTGDSRVVTIDDGSGACRYDLRARFDDGQTLVRSGVNVCQIADYYFTR